jgi:hypothetical protein
MLFHSSRVVPKRARIVLIPEAESDILTAPKLESANISIKLSDSRAKCWISWHNSDGQVESDRRGSNCKNVHASKLPPKKNDKKDQGIAVTKENQREIDSL